MEEQPNKIIGNQAHDKLYQEWKAALQTAAESPDLSAEQKAEIAVAFAVKKMMTKYAKWLTDKRGKDLETHPGEVARRIDFRLCLSPNFSDGLKP